VVVQFSMTCPLHNLRTMATIYNKEITNAKQVRYQVKLTDEESTLLTFNEEVEEATLDKLIAEELANREAMKDRQAKIDKAISEALWTDEERANLG